MSLERKVVRTTANKVFKQNGFYRTTLSKTILLNYIIIKSYYSLENLHLHTQPSTLVSLHLKYPET